MVSRRDTVKELVDENLLGCSYRRSVKPVAIAGTPTFRYSVYLEDERTDPPSYHLIDNLTKIPQEYINLGPNDKRTVLCQTGYTSLAEIKRFHRKVLASRGVPHEKFLWDCQHLDLSVDGVRETNTGRRTFHIMSVRLGGNIYMYRIFNPLIGNPLAKPDLEAVYR